MRYLFIHMLHFHLSKPLKSQILWYAIVKAVDDRFGVGGPRTLWRTKPRSKKGRAFMRERERLTSLYGNHNLYFSVAFFTRLINQGGRQTTESLCEEVYAAGTKNYYVLTFSLVDCWHLYVKENPVFWLAFQVARKGLCMCYGSIDWWFKIHFPFFQTNSLSYIIM